MELSKQGLERLLATNQFSDIPNPLEWQGIKEIIRRTSPRQEQTDFVIDPRTNEIVVYSPNRACRKENHDNPDDCPICIGNTTPVLLTKEFEDGSYCFANINSNPFLNPDGKGLRGANFLVWPSTKHKDIHEISYEDHTVCLELIAELEYNLYTTSEFDGIPAFQKNTRKYGHVQIIKNKGKAVGGSLEHGHYQLAFINKLPRKIQQDKEFLEQRGVSFAQYMLNENPKELQIKDYDSAVLITPYLMRRPLEALLIPKNTTKNYLHSNEKDELKNLARALTDITNTLSRTMPGIGKDFAYNLVFHTGPIGTMYIEILPYTQEEGGFEKSGLSVCQSNPRLSTEMYKRFLEKINLKL